MSPDDGSIVGKMARTGALMRAARLIRRGKPYEEIWNNLNIDWAPPDTAAVAEVIALAFAAVEAADFYDRDMGGSRPPESAVPLVPR